MILNNMKDYKEYNLFSKAKYERKQARLKHVATATCFNLPNKVTPIDTVNTK